MWSPQRPREPGVSFGSPRCALISDCTPFCIIRTQSKQRRHKQTNSGSRLIFRLLCLYLHYAKAQQPKVLQASNSVHNTTVKLEQLSITKPQVLIDKTNSNSTNLYPISQAHQETLENWAKKPHKCPINAGTKIWKPTHISCNGVQRNITIHTDFL